jgi:hypothetical protein
MKIITSRRARPTPELSLHTLTFSIHATTAASESLVSRVRLSLAATRRAWSPQIHRSAR